MKLLLSDQFKSLLIAFFSVLVIFGMSFGLAEKYSHSFKFVDEDEHMVVGWLLSKDYKLYQDISTNHQPLNYIISSQVQKITQPQNLTMLIKRHRQTVLLWSAIWAFIILYYGGLKTAPAILLFEATKYLALGNEFLAESLAAYPLALAFALFWKYIHDYDISVMEYFLFGLSVTTATFLSVPLAIPVILLTAFLIYKEPENTVFIASGIIPILALVFWYVNPADYYRETIYNNFVYAIPQISETHNVYEWFKVLTMPLQSFFYVRTALINWISYLFGMLIFGLYILFRKQQVQRYPFIILLLAWITTNIRVQDPRLAYYDFFHALPWYFVGLVLASVVTFKSIKLLSASKRQLYLAVLIITAAIFFFNSRMPWRTEINAIDEEFIQYSPLVKTSEIISKLKEPEDTMIVIPTEALHYWQNDLLPAGKQVTYYEWQWYPQNHEQEFRSLFNSEPLPTFIIYNNDESKYTENIQSILAEKYTKMYSFQQQSAGFSDLHVLNSRVEGLSSETLEELNTIDESIEILETSDED